MSWFCSRCATPQAKCGPDASGFCPDASGFCPDGAALSWASPQAAPRVNDVSVQTTGRPLRFSFLCSPVAAQPSRAEHRAAPDARSASPQLTPSHGPAWTSAALYPLYMLLLRQEMSPKEKGILLCGPFGETRELPLLTFQARPDQQRQNSNLQSLGQHFNRVFASVRA